MFAHCENEDKKCSQVQVPFHQTYEREKWIRLTWHFFFPVEIVAAPSDVHLRLFHFVFARHVKKQNKKQQQLTNKKTTTKKWVGGRGEFEGGGGGGETGKKLTALSFLQWNKYVIAVCICALLTMWYLIGEGGKGGGGGRKKEIAGTEFLTMK